MAAADMKCFHRRKKEGISEKGDSKKCFLLGWSGRGMSRIYKNREILNKYFYIISVELREHDIYMVYIEIPNSSMTLSGFTFCIFMGAGVEWGKSGDPVNNLFGFLYEWRRYEPMEI